jgi:hypothetical protein
VSRLQLPLRGVVFVCSVLCLISFQFVVELNQVGVSFRFEIMLEDVLSDTYVMLFSLEVGVYIC